MSTASKFVPHYTVQDYVQWEGNWELWEGIAVAMTPSPFGRHQRVLFALAAELRASIGRAECDATALGELDWIISEDTVVRPDVIVVCGDPPEKYLRNPPALIAEVLSESTRQNDLTYKRELYRRQRVAIYLVIDAEAETIQIDQASSDGSYQTSDLLGQIELQICDACHIRFDSESIFRR